MPAPVVAPSYLKTKAQLLWMYNQELRGPPIKKTVRENIKTICSLASQEINFTQDLQHMLDFTIHLATTKGMLRRYLHLSVAEANDALRWFIESVPQTHTERSST